LTVTGKTTKVSMVKSDNRYDAMKRSIELLNINPVKGKKVLLKPNFNTTDPYPGSTHPETLLGLVEYLNEMGAAGITIVERSGPVDSEQVMKQLGIYALAEKFQLEVVNIDKMPAEDLVKVDPPGSHWKDGFMVPRLLQEAECIVVTPCLKTHQYGGVFTMALKLAVGIVPKTINNSMQELHGSAHMNKMIAEINTAYTPDLIVLDAMEAFVEAGPMTGKRKRADLFLAGTDRIAIDAVGIAILKDLGSTPEIMNSPIFEQEQIARAVELRLGVSGPEQIEMVTADPESEEYANTIYRILTKG
jgi:uncharacterized protein (DUF362 family)